MYHIAIKVESCSSTLYEGEIRSNLVAAGSGVGVMENLPDEKLVLYPNPSSSIVYLQTPEWLSIEEVRLYNLLGYFVASYHPTDAINIEKLIPGVYFIEIITGNGIITQKIIKE